MYEWGLFVGAWTIALTWIILGSPNDFNPVYSALGVTLVVVFLAILHSVD